MSETDSHDNGLNLNHDNEAAEGASGTSHQPAPLTVVSNARTSEGKRKQRAETNRANAQRSTGPTSAHGKRTARKNAMKHGQTARTLLAESTDDPIFDSITERLRGEYEPQSLAEQLLIETAAMQWSRLAFAHNYERGRDATHRLFGGETLDRFLKYNAAAERSLFRSLDKLEERALEKAASDDAEDIPRQPDEDTGA